MFGSKKSGTPQADKLAALKSELAEVRAQRATLVDRIGVAVLDEVDAVDSMRNADERLGRREAELLAALPVAQERAAKEKEANRVAGIKAEIKRLEKIGNLRADGRPILGLDSRDLLEIVLESGDDAYLVPAHIWTPWFAMFGSKSGFDTVDECFGDLARHVFAIETGLSSDPAMNWRLSQLDRYRLVSNSDAHSPAKLGREATRFTGALDYFALRRALETGEGFGGTVEFFPEEGKYHLDGHRKCGVRLTPPESRAHGGRCPDCAGPLTIGTMNRVDELADRPDGFTPEGHDPFASFIPLPELIGEIEGVGPGSKQVARVYERVIDGVGPELFILDEAPLEELRTHGSELLAEAVARMRAGDVIRDPGYDGEYGTIRVFEPRELARRTCVGTLFDAEVMGEGATPDAPRPASADAADRDLEPSARADGATAPGVRQASHEASSTGQVVTAGAGGPHTGERERSATAAAADREAASVAGTSAARSSPACATRRTSPPRWSRRASAGGSRCGRATRIRWSPSGPWWAPPP